MATFAPAVKCRAVDDQPDMCRLTAVPGNENSVFVKDIGLLPEHDLINETGVKVRTGFVVRRMVNLQSHDVTVIERDKPPAIDRIKTAGAVSPRQASKPVDEFLFKHF